MSTLMTMFCFKNMSKCLFDVDQWRKCFFPVCIFLMLTELCPIFKQWFFLVFRIGREVNFGFFFVFFLIFFRFLGFPCVFLFFLVFSFHFARFSCEFWRFLHLCPLFPCSSMCFLFFWFLFLSFCYILCHYQCFCVLFSLFFGYFPSFSCFLVISNVFLALSWPSICLISMCFPFLAFIPLIYARVSCPR